MTNTPEFRKRRLVLPIYLPSLLFTAAESALLPVLPVSATGFGVNLATAGTVTTALMLGTLVFEVPASWIVSKLGERNAMLAASIGAALLTLLAFPHLSYSVLVIAAIGFGAMHALFGLSRHSLLTAVVPGGHRPKSMALLGGMFRGGAAIGPVIGAGFIAAFGDSYAYLAAAIMALTAGLSVILVNRQSLITDPSGQHGNVWKVAKRESAKLKTLGVASAIISAGRTIRLIGLPLLAIHLGIDAATTSFIFGLTGFIDFALFFASAVIMNRWGKVWSSVPTLFALGITYLFSFMVTDVTGFWILASATALANAASAGINMVLGADMAPEGARAEFLASFRMLTSGGVVAAPATISLLTAVVGVSGALALTGLVNFYGAYLFLRYLPIYAPDKKP